MSASHSRPAVDGFVTEMPPMLDIKGLRRAHYAAERLDQPQDREARLVRRDRRLALVFIVASSVVTIFGLYGAWTLLQGAV